MGTESEFGVMKTVSLWRRMVAARYARAYITEMYTLKWVKW